EVADDARSLVVPSEVSGEAEVDGGGAAVYSGEDEDSDCGLVGNVGNKDQHGGSLE
ncbi:hypothetical protein A2U01_0073740, partial [Trifolium medium]|nr:hypothetical protein [Trifolium medium]